MQNNHQGSPKNENTFTAERGLFIAFLLMVSIRIFWYFAGLFMEYRYPFAEGQENARKLQSLLFDTTGMLYWSIPLIMAFYSEKGNRKTIMIAVGLIVLIWNLCETNLI